MLDNLLYKFSRFGVLPREAVKNDVLNLRYLLKNGLVRKVLKKGRVFYELTEKSLPLLEDCRNVLLHEASLMSRLTPNSRFFQSLVKDLRFLDEKHPRAEDYRLLGDWHLQRPVVAGQLALSKMRYYRQRGFHG